MSDGREDGQRLITAVVSTDAPPSSPKDRDEAALRRVSEFSGLVVEGAGFDDGRSVCAGAARPGTVVV